MTDAINWHPNGTKGPWDLRDDYKRISVGIGLVDGPNGYDVAEVYNDDCDRDEAYANARAIAEVPAMVMALRELIDIEGPQPGTASWANKVHAILSRIDGGAA